MGTNPNPEPTPERDQISIKYKLISDISSAIGTLITSNPNRSFAVIIIIVAIAFILIATKTINIPSITGTEGNFFTHIGAGCSGTSTTPKEASGCMTFNREAEVLVISTKARRDDKLSTLEIPGGYMGREGSKANAEKHARDEAGWIVTASAEPILTLQQSNGVTFYIHRCTPKKENPNFKDNAGTPTWVRLDLFRNEHMWSFPEGMDEVIEVYTDERMRILEPAQPAGGGGSPSPKPARPAPP